MPEEIFDQRDGSDQLTDPPLALTELADAASVTVRTIRYYIAEGLLPPPVGAGPHSGYTSGHLDRLRLIGRLKDAYLPLKEIRRHLTGLDDAAVHAALHDSAATAPRAASTARDYLDTILAPARHLAEAPPHPRSRQPPVPAASSPAAPPPPVALLRETLEPPAPPGSPAAVRDGAEPWRRVQLADDAELLIREAAYQRHADQIEWLIGWARRVFD